MKSSFQTIVIILCAAAFFIAIAIFSGVFSNGKTASTSSAPAGEVVVWGVLPQEAMQNYVSQFNSRGLGYTLDYFEHKPLTLNQDLVNALANGNPPDVIIFSSETFSQLKDRLYTIPYAAYSERTFRDTNIDGAQIFLKKNGVLALPLLVDPLVVYYNKDILSAANFVVPPTTWSGLAQSVPLFTKRSSKGGGISQVAVALGTENNVDHVRDILSALFLQTGNQIVAYDGITGGYQAQLGGTGVTGAAQGLAFYTSFANPTSTTYSWNRSLPSSLQMFLSGKSAFYIGRASELFSIQAENPNLNFDVAPLFQPEGAARAITFGSFIAAGTVKNAPNFNAAYAAVTALSTQSAIDGLSKQFSLAPVRRDLLQVQQNNPYVAIFFRAALAAFSWPDPDPAKTEDTFRAMIINVNSGKSDAQSAIYDANTSLQSTIR